MNMGKYQVFLRVAACGGFTRAAEELHFTQSGVSHTIATLESELGVPLFVRNRSGVTLTAEQVEQIFAPISAAGTLYF